MKPDQKFMANMDLTSLSKRDKATYDRYKYRDCIVYYHLNTIKTVAQIIIKTKSGFKGYGRKMRKYDDGYGTEYKLYVKDVNDILKETEETLAGCRFIDKEMMPALKEWRIRHSI